MTDLEKSISHAHTMIAQLAKSLGEHKAELKSLHKRLDQHHARLAGHHDRIARLEDGTAKSAPSRVRRPSPSQERVSKLAFAHNVREGHL